MHRFMAAIVAASVLAVPSPATAGDTPDAAAVQKLFEAFNASWNTPGMPGFENLFVTDADFVVITGKWLRGRDEIVSYHRELLSTLYKGSHQFIEQIIVRFPDERTAIAHVSWGADIAVESKPVRRTALGTVTLQKVQGRWFIQSVHNTLTSGPGYSFGDAGYRPDQ